MAGTIMPSPKFLGLDNNADPLSGGKLYTYAAGTTTPQDTYSDVGLTTPNPNPVILDSAGRATVFLSNSSYKFVLKDSDDVTIWSQDNISTFNPTNLDIEGTAGEAVSAGDVVYLSDGSGGKTAGKWYKTDGDFDYASSLPTVALVTVAAAANASASLRIQGSYTFSSAIVAGQSYYLSATAGALATTPATYSRFFGVGAVDGFSVVFSPNPPNVVQSPTFATITATQAFILGSATTNGIRMDLSTGTMEIREGDDSAYGPLNTGALEAKGVLTVTAGTVSAPAMTTTGDTNTGVYFPAADEVAVTVNGGEELRVTASGIKPGANDGGSLGVSDTAWADLFLASGGVVDWNAGDTTLTHSAGKLTIAGSGAGALDVKGDVSPTANDGAALGSGTVSWADLFLASGGVLNFNNGDVTITHSSNTLAFAGASTAYTFADGPVSPASNDGAALGVSGTAWSDLFLASGGVINFNAGDVTITHSADTLTCAGATNYNFNDGDLTITRTSGTPTLSVVSTQAAGSAPATVGMARRGASNSATPNNSDIGIVSWAGLDSNAAYMRVAYIQASIGTNAVGGAPASLQFGTAASGASATERMRIPAAGGVQCVTTLSVGNATPASTGAGITFPAAQSASSDANTLDDYEEGTWTPTDASGAALTFTTATGSYVKIGKQVSAWGYVVYPATANASNALVGGLPFNVANEQVARGGGILAYSTETTALRAMANQNSANVAFYQSNGVAITNATCSGDTFYFCIHYYV